MNLRRVVPILTVTDLEATTATYVDVLGLEVVMNHGWIVTLADPGDTNRQFSLLHKDLTATVNPDLSIEVDNVDAAYEAAIRADAKIVHELTDEDWGVRRFFFEDDSGNIVNVLSHR